MSYKNYAADKRPPREVAVQWFNEGDDDKPFLTAGLSPEALAEESSSSFDDGEWQTIGIYELKKVVRVRRTTQTEVVS